MGGDVAEENEDSLMVQAVLDGDTEAYRALVERYERRVYHVVYGMVRNAEDAKEIAQEAFVKAFKSVIWLQRRRITTCSLSS